MLCTPALKPLVGHAAVRVLLAPVSATAPQPLMAVLSAVKATVPVGAVPATVAVNVTLAPTSDGLPELINVVLVDVLPPIATETVSRPDDPGVALMTLIVTPVVLSRHCWPTSTAASSKPP